MNYKLRLEKIKTVRELYEFREELVGTAERHSHLWDVEENPTNSENLKKCQEANFFLQRVNKQIEYFESHGLVLSSILIPEQKEKVFTKSDILSLKEAVEEIVSDEDVMKLFNKLLENK